MLGKKGRLTNKIKKTDEAVLRKISRHISIYCVISDVRIEAIWLTLPWYQTYSQLNKNQPSGLFMLHIWHLNEEWMVHSLKMNSETDRDVKMCFFFKLFKNTSLLLSFPWSLYPHFTAAVLSHSHKGWGGGEQAGTLNRCPPTKGYSMRQLPVHFHLSALTWPIVLWLHSGMRRLR